MFGRRSMEDVRLWQTILRCEEPYELRVVSVCEEDGSFTVEERTDGEQTLLAFDALCCVRRLHVQREHARLARWALGSVEESITTLLTKLFSSEDAFLSDVLDALDAAGVPYAYSIECGNDLQLRVAEPPVGNDVSTVSTK
jgi:hypothetical protein